MIHTSLQVSRMKSGTAVTLRAPSWGIPSGKTPRHCQRIIPISPKGLHLEPRSHSLVSDPKSSPNIVASKGLTFFPSLPLFLFPQKFSLSFPLFITSDIYDANPQLHLVTPPDLINGLYEVRGKNSPWVFISSHYRVSRV